jgi:hypothetical protein
MFYNKYLKYKNKYLKLKGGSSLIDEPFLKYIISFIQNYNIHKGIKEILIQFIKRKSLKNIKLSEDIIILNPDIKNFYEKISQYINNYTPKTLEIKQTIYIIGHFLSNVIDHYYEVIQSKLLDVNYCNYRNNYIVLHFDNGTPLTNNNPNINYIHCVLDKIDIEKIKDIIITSCNKSNIGIFISTINQPSANCKNIISKFNTLLESFQNTNIYNNISIIHLSGNFNDNIYTYENSINKNDIFYKIINIHPALGFNNNEIIKKHKTYYPNQLYIINDVGYRIFYKIINENDYNHMIDNIRILENTHWYKLIFGTPYCLRNRFTQSTGTCWMNATINSLILVPKIKYMLLKEWYNTDLILKNKTISFKNFNNSNNNLKSLLYSVVYNLFITKKKATSEDKNFVVSLAARIKGLYEHNNEFYYKKCISAKETNDIECNHNNTDDSKKGLLYGDGGDSGIGILTFLNNYLNSDTFLVIDYITITDKFIIDINNKTLITTEMYPTIFTKKNPIIIAICNQIQKVPEKLNINSVLYTLASSTILLSNHAICGINCDGKKYIYDSNNILSEDNWHDGSIINYQNMRNNESIDKIKFYAMASVIYIRDDYPESEGVLPPYDDIVY